MNKIVRTANIISVILFRSFLNVTRSIFFNVLMLTLGFCLGYYALAMKVHYYAISHNNYEYVQKIETHVKQLEAMDNEYTIKLQELLNDLKLFKAKLSHEKHHECDSTIGTLLYK